MPDAPKSPLPVSPRQLVGLLVVCVLVAWLLLPSKRDLLERQLRDGQRARALATLEGLSNWERRRDPEFYTLTELRLRRELLNTKSLIAVRQHIIAACVAAEKFQFKPEFNQEFLALLRHVPDIADTREVLRPFLPRMPQALRRSLYDALVARALADAQPVLAARVFAEFWATAPTDESATTEMIRLWRGAGQPAQALAALETYAKPSGGNLARTAPALARAHQLVARAGPASRGVSGGVGAGRGERPGGAPADVSLARDHGARVRPRHGIAPRGAAQCQGAAAGRGRVADAGGHRAGGGRPVAGAGGGAAAGAVAAGQQGPPFPTRATRRVESPARARL